MNPDHKAVQMKETGRVSLLNSVLLTLRSGAELHMIENNVGKILGTSEQWRTLKKWENAERGRMGGAEAESIKTHTQASFLQL